MTDFSRCRLRPIRCLMTLILMQSVWAGDKAPAEAFQNLKTFSLLMADRVEPYAGKPPVEPARSLSLVVEAANDGGGRLVFTRLNANASKEALEIAKNPPFTDTLSATIAADGSLGAFKGVRNMGVRNSVVEYAAGGQVQVTHDGGAARQEQWPEGCTVWPAALAEWLSKAHHAKGAAFTRHVADPWTRASATFTSEVTAIEKDNVTFSATIEAGQKKIESFEMVVSYEGAAPRGISIRNASVQMVQVTDAVSSSLVSRANASLTSLDIPAKDGGSLIKKIRAALSIKDVQEKPMFDSGLSEKEYMAALDEVKALDDAILTEDLDSVVAGCRVLMPDAEPVEIQRLMILAARTGTPESLAVVDACFDMCNSGRKMLGVRELGNCRDPRSIEAHVNILGKSDYRCRDLVKKTFLNLSHQHPDLKPRIGKALLRFLDRPQIWNTERTGDSQLDGVIHLLADYPAPYTTLTLNKYVDRTTLNERSEMIHVAGAIKDEVAVSMVRAMFADLRASPVGIQAGCKAAGELKDLLCVPPLIQLLNAMNPRIVEQANLVLKKISGEDFGAGVLPWSTWWNGVLERAAHPDKLIAAAVGGEEKSRIQALRMLALLQIPEANATLTQCARDASVEIRAESLRGLGRICGLDSLPLLITALKDPAEPVRTAALNALTQRTRQALPGDEQAWNLWLSQMRPRISELEEVMKMTGVAPAISPAKLAAGTHAGGSSDTASTRPFETPAPDAPKAGAVVSTDGTAAVSDGEAETSTPVIWVLLAIPVGLVAAYLVIQTRRDKAARLRARITKSHGLGVGKDLDKLFKS